MESSNPANVAGNTYDKYTTTNPVERRMMAGFFDALDAALDGLHPDRVLEVGAGEGRVTERLVERFPDADVVGLDLPDGDLADEWATLDVPMFFGDVTRLPFAANSVDLVVGLEVLEHVPGPAAALAEIARVCRHTAVLSVPREPIWRAGNVARGRYVRELGNTPGHVNHWSARRFERFVAERFDVVDVHRPLPWTMVRATPSAAA
ncbi:MAG: class I SAM-dependent methyltransferase [Ilumatobacter sp.]|uniref:class I SAM-dependent methyltransferase n=1 Tax=Ilumatobacter sp. TaxID=1967498 RepID=UPI002602A85A|nr:class I SAM-dependent methyltransferase [Ilumatobacter sp.]MDJ0768378.1 class I SAM-dependent methyltransferase [Ilumatobacter sp.]